MESVVQTRRTRFVCISDTHNASPKDGGFKLPPGDVLIHAGDLTNQGTFSEVKKTVDWIGESDYEVKIVVAGNHDITLDAEFYAKHGGEFHERYPQDSQACIDYITNHDTITYLNHTARTIRLAKPDGPKTVFTTFGSPLSPCSGKWAFGYEPLQDTKQQAFSSDEGPWKDIPNEVDIVITHTPPQGHCDASEKRSCPMLSRALSQRRPKLAVCGHVHDGWGAENVTWSLSDEHAGWRESGLRKYELGKGSKKLAKVDLTMRWRRVEQETQLATNDRPSVSENPNVTSTSSILPRADSPCKDLDVVSRDGRQYHWILRGEKTRANAYQHAETGFDNEASGAGSSLRSSRPVRADVLERASTCVVNAAIMANSRQGGASGGRSFNKPIIVDMDLPVWEPAEEAA